jgi:glycosyltransferase involved in cell wall biosynthesis
MKPKILIFSLGYYPKHVGGAEVAIKEITDRLGAAYEFHLICNRYDSTLPVTEKIGNVTVHRIGFTTKNPSMADLRKFPLHLNKLWYQVAAYSVAKRLHQQSNFHAIWGMMAHATGVPAGRFKRTFPDVRYILSLQEGDRPDAIDKKMRVFGRAWQAAFLQADVIQVISNFLGHWAKRKGYQGNIIRVPNAVNIKLFTQNYSDEQLALARHDMNLQPDDTALVTTSRLVFKNGIDTVIAALPYLASNVKFVVFGTGPDESKLKRQATALGVADRVIFKGFIDHAVMPQYLKACDIFIRPSRSEGMGNSFVEAMAAELPVIATQAGGIADFLFDATRNPDQAATGWAVDVDAPKQIAAAVEAIMADPPTTKNTVANAKAMALSEYDWDLVAQDMQTKVFSQVLPHNE